METITTATEGTATEGTATEGTTSAGTTTARTTHARTTSAPTGTTPTTRRWRRWRLLVPVAAVVALGAACDYKVVGPETLEVENGRPVEVCAGIVGLSGYNPPANGNFVFRWDAYGATGADRTATSVTPIDHPCRWHVYRTSGDHSVMITYQKPPTAPITNQAVPLTVAVTVTDPRDPQPFLSGYPTGLRTWSFLYRNRWLGSELGTVSPGAVLGPHRWRVVAPDGTLLVDQSGSSDSLDVLFPAAGDYRVLHTISATMDPADPTQTVESTDERIVTVP